MKITRVTATPLNVPIQVTFLGLNHKTSLSACLVEIETDNGIVGHGFTAITEEDVVAQVVNGVAASAIQGDDPLAHERVWDKLYWTLMPRGQTGYAAHALAAIDVALWDIKGKVLNQPIWRLLGGARQCVPLYATFGFGFLDRGGSTMG
jgi:L-alanine-DL-glutamate epimerase-like enolase superfamily enzyme